MQIYTAKPGAAEDHLMIQMALKKIILVLVRVGVGSPTLVPALLVIIKSGT